jgi:hypothetical protein
VVTGVGVEAVHKAGDRLAVSGSHRFRREVDLVLAVVGVRPDTPWPRALLH